MSDLSNMEKYFEEEADLKGEVDSNIRLVERQNGGETFRDIAQATSIDEIRPTDAFDSTIASWWSESRYEGKSLDEIIGSRWSDEIATLPLDQLGETFNPFTHQYPCQRVPDMRAIANLNSKREVFSEFLRCGILPIDAIVLSGMLAQDSIPLVELENLKFIIESGGAIEDNEAGRAKIRAVLTASIIYFASSGATYPVQNQPWPAACRQILTRVGMQNASPNRIAASFQVPRESSLLIKRAMTATGTTAKRIAISVAGNNWTLGIGQYLRDDDAELNRIKIKLEWYRVNKSWVFHPFFDRLNPFSNAFAQNKNLKMIVGAICVSRNLSLESKPTAEEIKAMVPEGSVRLRELIHSKWNEVTVKDIASFKQAISREDGFNLAKRLRAGDTFPGHLIDTLSNVNRMSAKEIREQFQVDADEAYIGEQPGAGSGGHFMPPLNLPRIQEQRRSSQSKWAGVVQD